MLYLDDSFYYFNPTYCKDIFMNKTFKVIWNSSKQTCSVASELSRSHAKSSSTTAHSTFSKIFKLSAVATLLSSVSLFANAESYQIVAGEIRAEANNAMAIGNGSKVTKEDGANRYGHESIAIGNNAHANSDSSTVIGTSSTSKNSSVTVGTESSSAEKAIAVGVKTNASGGYSVAIGHKAETTTNNAIATGYNARATGEAAIAHGEVANASGDPFHFYWWTF